MTSTASTATTPHQPIDISSWQYTFSLFDPTSTGFIATNDIGTIIRAMHHNITEQQCNTYINAYTNSDTVDFATLVHIVTAHIHEWSPPITPAQLSAAFASYDTYKTGQIHGSMLVDVLRNTGECMTQDDVDGLLCEITIDGDNMINIQQLIDYMVQSSSYPTDHTMTASAQAQSQAQLQSS